MKAPPAWQIRIVDTQIMPAPRQRSPSRRPSWIIILVSLVCLSLIGAYIFPPENYPACYFFASSVCNPFMDWLPPTPVREFTDEEIAANAVFTSLLLLPPVQVKVPKIAFLFLTPGTLPFERLWEKFFQVRTSTFSYWIDLITSCSWFYNMPIFSKGYSWVNFISTIFHRHFVSYISCYWLDYEFFFSFLNTGYITFWDTMGEAFLGENMYLFPLALIYLHCAVGFAICQFSVSAIHE